MLYRLCPRRNLDLSSLRGAVGGLDRSLGNLTVPLNLAFPQASRWVLGENFSDLAEAGFLAAGARIQNKNLHSSVWPSPVLYFRHIVAMLARVLLVLQQFVTQELLKMGANLL